MAPARIDRPSAVVVLVEDSDEDFDTAVEALRRLGSPAEVRRASTGGDGVALLRQQDRDRPTLVIMDLNTPGIDGREALSMIKSDPAVQKTPVVVFSTSANPRDVSYCYATGANAFHVKPVRYPQHVQTLTELFAYWLEQVVLPVDPSAVPG